MPALGALREGMGILGSCPLVLKRPEASDVPVVLGTLIPPSSLLQENLSHSVKTLSAPAASFPRKAVCGLAGWSPESWGR